MNVKYEMEYLPSVCGSQAMAWSVFSKSGDMDHVVLDEFPREGVDIVESLLHPAQGEM